MSMESCQKTDLPGSGGYPLTELKTFLLWKGRLLVRGGNSCSVHLVTDVDTASNFAFLYVCCCKLLVLLVYPRYRDKIFWVLFRRK